MENKSIAMTLLIVAGIILGAIFGLVGVAVGAVAGLIAASVYGAVTHERPTAPRSAD